jgi:O-antigen/teichoic acid export membrane protein
VDTLHISVTIASLLVLSVLGLVFFELEFKNSRGADAFRNTVKLLSGAAIFFILTSCVLGFSQGNNANKVQPFAHLVFKH